jgi:hypothetical protein
MIDKKAINKNNLYIISLICFEEQNECDI